MKFIERPGPTSLAIQKSGGDANVTMKQVTIMADNKMTAQMSGKSGFIAALDQSGGSTPETLRLYGIPDSAYGGEVEMYRLIHEMRVRIMSAAAFTGDKVIGTILYQSA
jgi:fructose-bisphosphate aldolase class I